MQKIPKSKRFQTTAIQKKINKDLQVVSVK